MGLGRQPPDLAVAGGAVLTPTLDSWRVGKLKSNCRASSVLLAALLVLGVGAAPARGQTVVEQVVVEVAFEGAEPHRALRTRVEATVYSVAERLLVGRSVEQVAALQPRPEETIAVVVERVTIGYAVSASAVLPGATATVLVRMRPVGPLVRETMLTIDLRAVHERVRPLISALLAGGPAAEMQAGPTGLPIAAFDWAGPVIDALARGTLEAVLPGFTAAARLQPGEVARLDLSITPKDSRVIRNIGVRFRSGSIPTVLLEQHGPQVASMGDPLRGLPVMFVEVHRRSLEGLLNDDLAAYPPAVQYGIVAIVRLDVAETTYMDVTAESLVYRARVEAHLNIGPAAPEHAVLAHVGRLMTPQTEAFVEIRIVPQPLSLTADVGMRYAVSPTAAVGATYAPATAETMLWTSVQLSRDLGLRSGWTLPTQVFEGAVTYRINEFLAWELVGTTRGDVWVRLVSNL